MAKCFNLDAHIGLGWSVLWLSLLYRELSKPTAGNFGQQVPQERLPGQTYSPGIGGHHTLQGPGTIREKRRAENKLVLESLGLGQVTCLASM
jgi:hypothetical protein